MIKKRVTDLQKRILNRVRQDGSISTQMVVKALKTSPLTASRNLGRLVELGLLLKEGKGRGVFYIPRIGTQLEEIERLKQELDSYRPFPEPIVEQVDQMLRTRFIYSTRTIEGARMPLRETALVLSGLSIKGNREEISDILHQKKALDLVDKFIKNKQEFSEQWIKSLQREVTSNVSDIMLNGVYRDHEAGISGSTKLFPNPTEISQLMPAYVAAVLRMEKTKQHPAIIAAYAHYKLLAIHPFADGNGRTARLLMNAILLKYHYPITIIEPSKRQEYYLILQKADQDDYEIFESFIFSAINDSMEFYLKMVRP